LIIFFLIIFPSDVSKITKYTASYTKIETGNKHVLAFERSKNGSTIIYIVNLSNQGLKTSLSQKGKYLDYISNSTFELNGDAIELSPWEYKILIK